MSYNLNIREINASGKLRIVVTIVLQEPSPASIFGFELIKEFAQSELQTSMRVYKFLYMAYNENINWKNFPLMRIGGNNKWKQNQ